MAPPAGLRRAQQETGIFRKCVRSSQLDVEEPEKTQSYS